MSTTTEQRIVSDVEFEASMNWVMVELNARSYFWDWHRAEPHLSVYDMYRRMDEEREAQALEEWESHVAEDMALYRQAVSDAAAAEEFDRERSSIKLSTCSEVDEAEKGERERELYRE